MIKDLILSIKKYFKCKKCIHEWKEFDSGYKQCTKCFKIEKK